MENKQQVIKLLAWFQNYAPQPSPTYLTIFNFDDTDKTYTLMLFNTRMDVQRSGDKFYNHGLWRMVTEDPAQITAHRIHDLVPHIEKYDPTLEWTLKGLKRILFHEHYNYAKNQYMKFRTDFPDIESLAKEGEAINREEDIKLHEIMRQDLMGLFEDTEDSEPKVSAKDKAKEKWNLEEDE